jgi:putative transferase (TIGR04331 family)
MDNQSGNKIFITYSRSEKIDCAEPTQRLCIYNNQNLSVRQIDMPHPWENQAKYKSDYECVYKYGEDLINWVGLYFSKTQDFRKSQKFWRILIGRLTHELAVVYYFNLRLVESLEESFEGSEFHYTSCDISSLSLKRFTDSMRMINSIEFNSIVFSLIVKDRKMFVPRGYAYHSFGHIKFKFSSVIKLLVKKLWNSILIVLKPSNIYYHSYFAFSELIKLSVSSKRICLPFFGIDYFPLTKGRYGKCKQILREEYFVFDLLYKALPDSIFSIIKNEIYCGYTPKNIITAIGDITIEHEMTRYLLAQWTFENARLIIRQHGGVYGSASFFMIERMQRMNCDIFLTWGWEEDVKTLPIGIKPVTNKPRLEVGDIDLLLINVAYPKFYYHMFPSPQYAKMKSYINDIQTIIKQTNNIDNKRNFVIRNYNSDFGWNIKSYLGDTIEKNGWSLSKDSFLKELRRSNLVVVTYNSTVHLQSMSLGVPTLLFFAKNNFEMRECPWVQGLIQSSIMHTDCDSLISTIRTLMNSDVRQWWRYRQHLVQGFLDKYYRVSENYLSEFNNVIK